MPLSEQEQRLLDEMERHLYRNDADFVSTSGDRRGRPTYRSIAIGCLVALVGVGALVTGVIIQQPIVGIIGFVVMLAGVLIAMSPSKRGAPESADLPGARQGSGARRARGSFMQRMNDRWDRREDDQR